MKTLKKQLAILLTLLMALSLAACGGSSTPDDPSDADLKKDVQSYITEVVAPDAEITKFAVEDSGAGSEDNTYEATCIVNYADDSLQYVDEFDLNYTVKDGKWELDKCKVNSEYDGRSSQAVGADTTAADSSAEGSEAASTTAASETVTQSDKLEDYTFTLEGVVYQLPFAYTQLTDNGWRIYSSGTYEDDKIGGTQYDTITMEKDGKQIDVDVINMSGNAKLRKDCNIGSITVFENQAEKMDFSIAKGIKVGASEDDVREAFGDPSDSNDYDEYTSLRYGDDDSSYIETVIVCDKGTDDYKDSYIQLQNFVATEDEEKTQSSDEVPSYLSTYKAPSELGDDKLSGNVEIEGDVYTLPAAPSAFTDNGWKVASNEDVASGRTGYLKLSKDGKEMEVQVKNLADYQTKASNCAVIQISVYHYDGDSKEVSIKLPGGVTIGTSSADLKNWAGDKFDYEKSDDSETYSYYESDEREFNMYVRCEKTVESITIENATWPTE